MNEFEQPDKLLEQSLHVHYHVRFRESHGSAPAASEVWQQVSARLEPGMSAHPWWQGRLLKPRTPKATLCLPASHHTPIRRLAVACSLALGILLLVSSVFSATEVVMSHQRQHQMRGGTSDAVALLLSQLLLNSKQPGTRLLAQDDLFTQVNHVGSDQVKLQKVYADANILILGFTANQPLAGAPSITLSDGQTLPLEMSEESDPAKRPIAILAYFDAGSIQGNPQQLHLSISIPLVGETQHFDLTESFHAGKIVQVNQTATFSGRTYTFERVVITPYETRLYYTYRQGKAAYDDTVMMISILGKTYDPATGFGKKGEKDWLDFEYDLRGHMGIWTLKVLVPSQCCLTPIGQITFLVA